MHAFVEARLKSLALEARNANIQPDSLIGEIFIDGPGRMDTKEAVDSVGE